MDTTKKRTRAESDADLERKINELDWDETTEVSVVIHNPGKPTQDEPSSLAQVGWRIYQSLPHPVVKVVLVVGLGVAAAWAKAKAYW